MPSAGRAHRSGQSKHGCPETSALRDTALHEDNFALQCGRRLAFIQATCAGSSPLMKYSVWLKEHTAADSSLHPDGQTPALRIPDIRSQSDGRVKQPAAVFLVRPIPGTAGGRRLLRITRS